jgi:dimeric dUTPase (all-alpha-NTP-PPase superfamily)
MLSDNEKIELIINALEKQDELNTLTNGLDWRTNPNLKWYRAIWTECAELIDYTNWKWWKKETISINDVKMEIIDILHFMMSELIKIYNIEKSAKLMFNGFKYERKTDFSLDLEKVRLCAETLVVSSIQANTVGCFNSFLILCKSLNLDFENLYKLYIAKNVLNRFRQAHGYKQQTYQKIWNGQEDNVYLMDILENVPIDKNIYDTIYSKLETQYKKVLEEQQ